MALVREKVSFILLRGFLPGVEQRGIRGKVGKKGRARVSPNRGNRDKEVVKRDGEASSGAHQSRGTRELSRVKPRKLNPGPGWGEINARGLSRQGRKRERERKKKESYNLERFLTRSHEDGNGQPSRMKGVNGLSLVCHICEKHQFFGNSRLSFNEISLSDGISVRLIYLFIYFIYFFFSCTNTFFIFFLDICTQYNLRRNTRRSCLKISYLFLMISLIYVLIFNVFLYREINERWRQWWIETWKEFIDIFICGDAKRR